MNESGVELQGNRKYHFVRPPLQNPKICTDIFLSHLKIIYHTLK